METFSTPVIEEETSHWSKVCLTLLSMVWGNNLLWAVVVLGSCWYLCKDLFYDTIAATLLPSLHGHFRMCCNSESKSPFYNNISHVRHRAHSTKHRCTSIVKPTKSLCTNQVKSKGCMLLWTLENHCSTQGTLNRGVPSPFVQHRTLFSWFTQCALSIIWSVVFKLQNW